MAVYMNRRTIVPEIEKAMPINPFVTVPDVADVHIDVSNPALSSSVRVFNRSGRQLAIREMGGAPDGFANDEMRQHSFSNTTNEEQMHSATWVLSDKSHPLIAGIMVSVVNAPGGRNEAEFLCVAMSP